MVRSTTASIPVRRIVVLVPHGLCMLADIRAVVFVDTINSKVAVPLHGQLHQHQRNQPQLMSAIMSWISFLRELVSVSSGDVTLLLKEILNKDSFSKIHMKTTNSSRNRKNQNILSEVCC